MGNQDASSRADEDSTEGLSYAREHPIATALLVVAMLGGAAAGYVVLSESLTPIRSILGGALAGFGCWLLVMVGRVIGE